MYNILICEDEPLIGLGLQKIVRESGLPVRNIYLTEDGRQALDQLAACDVQIVLTDIAMPGLNGLEFLGQVLSGKPETQCVIISGYSEFAYAQLAMKLGVRDYLLKPIDRQELYQVLSHCIEVIEQRHSQEMLLPELLYAQLLQAAGREVPGDTAARIAASGIRGPFFACAAFHVCGASENGARLAMEAVTRMPAFGNAVLLPTDLHGFQAVLSLEAAEELPALCGSLDCCLRDLRDELRVYCGVGEAVGDPFALHSSAEAAEKALCIRFFPQAPVLSRGAARNLGVSCRGWEPLAEALVQTLRECEAAAVGETLAPVCEFLRRLPAEEQPELRPLLADLAGRTALLDAGIPSPLGVLDTADSLREFQSEWRRLLLNWCQARWRERENSRDAVSRAITYMEQHYDRDIGLTTLANVVSMNYTYFSGIFKKRTGMSVSRYLQRVRIDRSKLLLAETALRIYEIAHAVGFADEHYYVKIFKQFEGVTPSDYRLGL